MRGPRGCRTGNAAPPRQFAAWTAALVSLPIFATTSAAVPVVVSWRAIINDPIPGGRFGDGTLSGVLGEFNVDLAAGINIFPLSVGTIITAAGFYADWHEPLGFAEGDWVVSAVTGGLAFRFAGLTSGGLVPTSGLAIANVPPATCAVNGVAPGNCRIDLSGSNFASVHYQNRTDPSIFYSKSAPMSFSFVVVPEPATVLLVGLGIAVIAVRRTRG